MENNEIREAEERAAAKPPAVNEAWALHSPTIMVDQMVFEGTPFHVRMVLGSRNVPITAVAIPLNAFESFVNSVNQVYAAMRRGPRIEVPRGS